MEGSKTLGSFLKDVMKARGLTERTLAQGAGIAQSGLSNVIQGKAREPDPRTLRSIADYLGIDVFILFRLLGYVPPATEPYGAFSPMALYIAQRFESLPDERQQVMLHVLESLLDDIEIKREVQNVRNNANLAPIFGGVDTLVVSVTTVGRSYLTNKRFDSADDIDLHDGDEVYPGILFGQLDDVFRRSLVAFLRHAMRQIYSPESGEMEYP